MTIHDHAENAAELLQRALSGLPSALQLIADTRLGYGGNKRPDPMGRGSRSVIWCDIHECEVRECQEAEELCDGIPIAAQGDPTGDLAVALASGEADPAGQAQRRIAQTVRVIEREADKLLTIVASWQPHRAPSQQDQRAAERENEQNRLDPMKCCEVCLKWEDSDGSRRKVPLLVQASEAAGAPMRLCRWHHDFATDWGRLPTEEEERQHQLGKVVRVRETERLIRGLETGQLGKAG